MDLERSLDVTAKFVTEMAQQRTMEMLQTVAAAAQQASNPQTDEQLKNQLRTLLTALKSTESNQWPPSQRRLLDQLNLSQSTGLGLLQRIEQIMTTEGVTRAAAGQQLAQLLESVRAVVSAATQIATSFNGLKVRPQPLAVQQCEVAILLPAAENRDTLEAFDNDIEGFNRLLKHLNEVAGESGVSPRISGLSSGSWQIYVEMGIKAVALLTKAIVAIIALRRRVAGLKQTSAQLQTVPDTAEIIKQIGILAEQQIENGLRDIAIEVVNTSTSVEGGRKHELTNAVSINIRFLAKKLDEGARVEINAPKELPKSTQQDKSPEEIEDLARALDNITEAAPQIAKMEGVENPVLMLSDPAKAAADSETV